MVRRVVSSIAGSRVFDLVYARVGSMVIEPIDRVDSPSPSSNGPMAGAGMQPCESISDSRRAFGSASARRKTMRWFSGTSNETCVGPGRRAVLRSGESGEGVREPVEHNRVRASAGRSAR